MQVIETNNEGLKRDFKIVVPAADIEEQISKRLGELSRTVRLPGFRPGKVPVALLRKRFGPAVMGEVLEKTVSESTQKAMTDRGMRPAMEPKIEITSFEEGADLEQAQLAVLEAELDVGRGRLALGVDDGGKTLRQLTGERDQALDLGRLQHRVGGGDRQLGDAARRIDLAAQRGRGLGQQPDLAARRVDAQGLRGLAVDRAADALVDRDRQPVLGAAVEGCAGNNAPG